jgi:hypothetical protein
MRLPQYVIGTRINGCKIDTHTHYIIYASINLSITAIIVRTDWKYKNIIMQIYSESGLSLLSPHFEEF